MFTCSGKFYFLPGLTAGSVCVKCARQTKFKCSTKLPQFERVGQFWRFKSSVQCSQGQGGGGWAPFHAEHDTPAVIFHTCLPWREVTTRDRVAKSQWPNVEEWDTFREAIPYQKWSFFNMLKNCNWVGSNATSYCGKNIVQTDLGKQSFKRLFRFGWFFSSARLLKCNTFCNSVPGQGCCCEWKIVKM